MFINYYFVQGCTYSPYHGKNVIFAPDGTPEELLHQYDFQKAEDGRYFRILTEKEYEAVMKGYPDNNVTFSYENSQPMYDNPSYKNVQNVSPITVPPPKEQNSASDTVKANILGIVSVFLLLLAILIVILFHDTALPFLIATAMIIVSLITAIVLCLRYPENLFGRILIGVYIILGIIAVILIIYAVIACIHAVTECINDCQECMTSCSGMG